MEFQGLTKDDLNNVRALNRAWLALPGRSAGVIAEVRRRERLSRTPFLLFSLHENDESLWNDVLGEAPQQDLFAARQPPARQMRDLQADALAFLWELARRNPYVCRVVSGAPLSWCELLASVTLCRLLRRTRRLTLVVDRFEENSPLYRRLLLRGSSALRDARLAAHMSALQALLTQVPQSRYERLPAAACRMRRSYNTALHESTVDNKSNQDLRER